MSKIDNHCLGLQPALPDKDIDHFTEKNVQKMFAIVDMVSTTQKPNNPTKPPIGLTSKPPYQRILRKSYKEG
jgi:hypothetical protein